MASKMRMHTRAKKKAIQLADWPAEFSCPACACAFCVWLGGCFIECVGGLGRRRREEKSFLEGSFEWWRSSERLAWYLYKERCWQVANLMLKVKDRLACGRISSDPAGFLILPPFLSNRLFFSFCPIRTINFVGICKIHHYKIYVRVTQNIFSLNIIQMLLNNTIL